ncbi:hypothetical protein OG787_12240 [Streptomyces sp. NBC_00075]|uniref:hypothetical protein n=1 Tax=Streptomyces sp. NBC_00075 TaxID=2975641 RepID=UPI0032504556
MSTLATYSFLPWLRQGIAGQITAADLDPSVRTRAGIHVSLRLTGEPIAGGAALTRTVERDVQLYGPGDVVGIDPRAIVRNDPRDWITDAEPNYLAHVEFYDEDFPWRYTPAGPDGTGLRLRPWIALVVLEEDTEFEEESARSGRPLPSVKILDPAALPAAEELWAWAHVQVNTSLSGPGGELTSTDMAAVMPRLSSALASNRDLAYSRLVCPRRLKPNTPYHAFVVPVFETGRLAGLGLDPAKAPHATFSAWADYANKEAGAALPVYHRWYFRTGGQGDFEHLVRLLQPRTVDSRVGVRDVDVRHPGSNLTGITDPALGGILKLGGALRVPRSALTPEEREIADRYEEWDQSPPASEAYPQPFQRDLAAFVNLPDDYAQHPAFQANADSGLGPAIEGSRDPLITAPLYGRWHALTRRLLTERDGTPQTPADNWVHELNLDPRHRLAAGFGTRVIQTNQEHYMEAAWGQIGEVLEANRRIRQARLAQLVAGGWWATQFASRTERAPERALTLTAPAHRHVLLTDAAVRPEPSAPGTAGRAATLRHRLSVSAVPATAVSAAMRRLTRPRARLMRSLTFGGRITPGTLLTRIDAGEVSASPPVLTPPGVVTTDELADTLHVPLPGWLPRGPAAWLTALLRRHPWLPWLVLVLGFVALVAGAVLLTTAGAALALALLLIGLALLALARALHQTGASLGRADGLRPQSLTVEAVDRLPDAPGFDLVEPGEPQPVPAPGATGDSPTAIRLKTALRDWHRLHEASLTTGAEPQPVRYGRAGLARLAAGAVAAVNPAVTLPRRTLHALGLPQRVQAELTEDFGEVMAYPRIDQPMYEPLADLSDDLLLPNLNLIPQNTVTLLETNQAFIEAYMVGLNHEMARELLWREYPTDQRGTPFRQFWDVRGARTAPGLTPEQAAESLRDIPELHRWRRGSRLGEHDHREVPGETEQEAVLVIRGELLKKYPNAVIYAHRAQWAMSDGRIDPGQERTLVEVPAAQQGDPPRDIVRTPLYEARVDPDITFFGFDLTVEEARGGTGDDPQDPAGWFFCIQEQPGEPRFGFDVTREGHMQTVNDLAWPDMGVGEGAFVGATALGTVALAPLGPGDGEKTEQRADDVKVVTASVSAARWAYLLYQSPVLVAVHAAEMLRREDA